MDVIHPLVAGFVVAVAFAGVAPTQTPTQNPPKASPASQPKATPDPNRIWAKLLADLPRHPKARHTIEAVRAAVASNPKYAGFTPKLTDRTTVGLVPLGENPVTKLWEFYDLRSAWDGTRDPRDIPLPEHRPDGTIEIGDDTGIVLVLLPGGAFSMGAQESSETDPGFDPRAFPAEAPVVRVELTPFLIARHEITQGQWARLARGMNVAKWPSVGKVGAVIGGKRVTAANPVDRVDWTSCNNVLTQNGFVLPTEAQWEYACRAGTSTPWWPGDSPEDLAGKENVRDKTGNASIRSPGPSFAFDDGHFYSSPVGCFAANAFGLHDVHGNVREWCLDEKASNSDLKKAGTGQLLPRVRSDHHFHRGGSFFCDLPLTRSSYRNYNVPTFTADWLGARPARLIPE